MASAKLTQPDQGKIKFTSQLISNFNNNNNDKQLKKLYQYQQLVYSTSISNESCKVIH